MAAAFDRAADGSLVCKSWVMAIMVRGGEVRPGARVALETLPEPRRPLQAPFIARQECEV
jgi:hypothetical protein